MSKLKSVGNRAAALLLAALLLCVLTACGEPDPNEGRYLCTSVTVGEDTVSPEELYNGEVSLELRAFQRGILRVGENEGDVRWTMEEGVFSVEVNGAACPASLEDGTIRLDLLREGVVLTLVREDLAALLPTPTPQPEMLAACAGDYYGRWEIENSQGSMPNTWYDCCASARLMKDGLVITLWDERTSRDEPMGVISWTSDGETISSSEGWFWYDSVEEGALSLTAENGEISFSGHHDGSEESFDYRVLLRPWGARWEDAENKPYAYRIWYLPLIEAGEDMPDAINR